MRDIRTVISRVQCDLPITDEEREGLEKHLEEFAKFQKKKNTWFCRTYATPRDHRSNCSDQIRYFIMTIPSSWLDPVKVERIIWHWTGGSYTASSLDKQHYHLLIEGDGELVKGEYPISAIVPPLYVDKCAAHTLNLNSWSIGCAVCCMGKAVESPFDPGPYPILQEQWDRMVEVSAQLCQHYKIPVTKQTLLTHAEVQANTGVYQRGKWDITVIPTGKGPVKETALAVGARLRTEVEGALSELIPPKPAANPSAWIRTPNGSVFLVEKGWTWEEVK